MDKKMKPIEWNTEAQSLEQFKRSLDIKETVDNYESLLEELFLIRNPIFKMGQNYSDPLSEFKALHAKNKSFDESGRWFFFPWSNKLVHYLTEEEHQELRTARNKNIITKEEQNILYDFTVGVAGLSVGSHAALTISLMGMCKHIKLADPDVISGSNLNRIRYDFTTVGKRKIEVVREYIYQMNPYAIIDEFKDGITPENIQDFLEGSKKIDLLIEEMDDLEMKIRIRIAARKIKIPVIMATDNGDNVILDIERFDLDQNTELFNGAAGKLTLEEFKQLHPKDMPKLATRIAGPDVVVPRMLNSLLEVGKTLYSWPQLGDAATLAGVILAYATKRIALNQKIKAGKLEVNLDSILDPDYNNPSSVVDRKEIRDSFLKIVGLA